MFDGVKYWFLMVLDGMCECMVWIGFVGKIFLFIGWKVGYIMGLFGMIDLIVKVY